MPRTARSLASAALLLLVASVATASTESVDGDVRSDGRRTGSDWWPRIESIRVMLLAEKWKRALKHARRLADRVRGDAWSGRDLDRVMAELAFQQAMAELNEGRPNDALWHWYTALNLRPEIEERDLTPYGLGAELADLGLRRPGDMPEGTDPRSDLNRLRLEPATLPRLEPPEITASAVATLRRQPDVLIEVVVDRQGAIRQPVLLTEGAHPVMVYTAFEWLSRMRSAQPARLDGRPVDSLELVNVAFAIDRKAPQVRLPDIDN